MLKPFKGVRIPLIGGLVFHATRAFQTTFHNFALVISDIVKNGRLAIEDFWPRDF